jgi:hypothetical protein
MASNGSPPPKYGVAPHERPADDDDLSGSESPRSPNTPDSTDNEPAPPYLENLSVPRAEQDGRDMADKMASITIKERLAYLGGMFPMDEAVVPGAFQVPSCLPDSPAPGTETYF